MSLFPPEEKPKTNWPLILGLCAAAGGAYYMFVHVPRPRSLKLDGPDSRINGVYVLQTDQTLARKHYDDNQLTYPNGEWRDQVWKNTANDCYIYDHQSDSTNDTWGIGPWNATDGGQIFGARYAYLWVPKTTSDKKVPAYKASQTFGVDVGRSLNPLMSWDVMQFGFFHNGWTQCNGCVTYGWTDKAGTVKLKAE